MIDPKIPETIEGLLNLHNGQRRLRLIVVEEVKRDLQLVLDGSQMEFTIGGSVPNSYNYQATTTITVVARHTDGRIGIGVDVCDAIKPGPGRCWKSLGGINDNWKPETVQKRFNSWVERDADLVLGPQGAWWPEGPATLVERELLRSGNIVGVNASLEIDGTSFHVNGIS